MFIAKAQINHYKFSIIEKMTIMSRLKEIFKRANLPPYYETATTVCFDSGVPFYTSENIWVKGSDFIDCSKYSSNKEDAIKLFYLLAEMRSNVDRGQLFVRGRKIDNNSDGDDKESSIKEIHYNKRFIDDRRATPIEVAEAFRDGYIEYNKTLNIVLNKRELSPGNHIMYNNKICTVWSVDVDMLKLDYKGNNGDLIECCFYDKLLEPIRLTDEILERVGFTRVKSERFPHLNTFILSYFDINIVVKNFIDGDLCYTVGFEYTDSIDESDNHKPHFFTKTLYFYHQLERVLEIMLLDSLSPIDFAFTPLETI